MWTIVKGILFLIVVVIAAQLVLGFIGNVIGENDNVRGRWQTGELGGSDSYRSLPKSSSLEFIPEPIRGWTVKGRDFVVTGWYKTSRWCRMSYASLKAKLT